MKWKNLETEDTSKLKRLYEKSEPGDQTRNRIIQELNSRGIYEKEEFDGPCSIWK